MKKPSERIRELIQEVRLLHRDATPPNSTSPQTAIALEIYFDYTLTPQTAAIMLYLDEQEAERGKNANQTASPLTPLYPCATPENLVAEHFKNEETGEEQTLPCGCTFYVSKNFGVLQDRKGPVFWNRFNKGVQCHKCGARYTIELPATTEQPL